MIRAANVSMNILILMAVGILNPISLRAEGTETADCAKVSPVEGTVCPKLRVKFDLSACNDKIVEPAIVKCEGKKATVLAHSSSYAYKVVFEEVESWGKKTYEMVGFVNKDALVGSQPTKETQASVPAPKTKPAPRSISQSTPQSTSRSTPTLTPQDDLSFNGLFDGYYSYNFDRPRSVVISSTSTTIPAGKNSYRAYDTYHNQFALNQIELGFKKISGPVSFVVDFDFGKMADLNHAMTSSSGSSVTDEVSKHIGQAVVSYTSSGQEPWTFSFGKMPTHIGYEVIKAKDNWQYSRSLTYWYGIPVWHLGASFSGPVNETVTASAYIYNGWNQLYDNNDGKTFGIQLKWIPDSSTTVIYNLITGPELDKDNGSWRSVNEANISYQLSSDLSVAGEGLFGYEPTTVGDSNKWIGLTSHLKWDADKKMYLSPRLEYFRDSSGSRLGTSSGQAQNMISGTFTVGLNIAKGLTVKPELRMDWCKNSEIFTTRTNETKRTQVTASVAALYNF